MTKAKPSEPRIPPPISVLIVEGVETYVSGFIIGDLTRYTIHQILLPIFMGSAMWLRTGKEPLKNGGADFHLNLVRLARSSVSRFSQMHAVVDGYSNDLSEPVCVPHPIFCHVVIQLLPFL